MGVFWVEFVKVCFFVVSLIFVNCTKLYKLDLNYNRSSGFGMKKVLQHTY